MILVVGGRKLFGVLAAAGGDLFELGQAGVLGLGGGEGFVLFGLLGFEGFVVFGSLHVFNLSGFLRRQKSDVRYQIVSRSEQLMTFCFAIAGHVVVGRRAGRAVGRVDVVGGPGVVNYHAG